MQSFYYKRNDFKIVLYGLARILLGAYLLIHAMANVLNYDYFIAESLSYFGKENAFRVLANLTPIVPLLEFFLAILIVFGIYTKSTLKWAIGLGLFFTIFFHATGDYETALIHSYTSAIKVVLYTFIAYNTFSLDYYNLWLAHREATLLKLRIKERL